LEARLIKLLDHYKRVGTLYERTNEEADPSRPRRGAKSICILPDTQVSQSALDLLGVMNNFAISCANDFLYGLIRELHILFNSDVVFDPDK